MRQRCYPSSVRRRRSVVEGSPRIIVVHAPARSFRFRHVGGLPARAARSGLAEPRPASAHALARGAQRGRGFKLLAAARARACHSQRLARRRRLPPIRRAYRRGRWSRRRRAGLGTRHAGTLAARPRPRPHDRPGISLSGRCRIARALRERSRPLRKRCFAMAFGSASRWYIGRVDLEGFATASLDRAIGRSVDAWLGDDASAVGRLLRRLQSEVQLVFHVHPVNEAREERDEPVVNSIWLSGCGRAQPAEAAASPEIAASLRAPLLAGDWASWAEAWN